jgi:hypothetical protein
MSNQPVCQGFSGEGKVKKGKKNVSAVSLRKGFGHLPGEPSGHPMSGVPAITSSSQDDAMG